MGEIGALGPVGVAQGLGQPRVVRQLVRDDLGGRPVEPAHLDGAVFGARLVVAGCRHRGIDWLAGLLGARAEPIASVNPLASRDEQLANIRQIYSPEREALGVVAIGIELAHPR